MEFAIGDMLYPTHIDHRTAIRLSATCKDLSALFGLVLDHLGQTSARATLRNVQGLGAEGRDPWRVVRHAWLTVSQVRAHSRSMLVMCEDGALYRAGRPPRARVLRHLKRYLCRECLTRTRSRAFLTNREAGVRSVLVCPECGRDPHGYSSMMSRAEALDFTADGWRPPRRKIQQVLGRIGVARVAGNRAHLFWRSAFLDAMQVEGYA